MADEIRYSEVECLAFLNRLFPSGAAGDDVFTTLTPYGWQGSPFFLHFHPTAEMVYREALKFRERQKLWPWRNEDVTSEPPPSFEEILRDHKEQPCNPEEEMRDLIGACLWGVFSDNHEVVDEAGRIVDLGSFRGAGGVIADWLNEQSGRHSRDYLNFYCSSWHFEGRVDVTPIYRLIFERVKREGADWIYSHPRLGLVDFSGIEAEDMGAYSPSEAFGKEQEREERRRESEKMRAELDEIYRQSCEEACKKPPPATVRAYREIFGRVLEGWPPRA